MDLLLLTLRRARIRILLLRSGNIQEETRRGRARVLFRSDNIQEETRRDRARVLLLNGKNQEVKDQALEARYIILIGHILVAKKVLYVNCVLVVWENG